MWIIFFISVFVLMYFAIYGAIVATFDIFSIEDDGPSDVLRHVAVAITLSGLALYGFVVSGLELGIIN